MVERRGDLDMLHFNITTTDSSIHSIGDARETMRIAFALFAGSAMLMMNPAQAVTYLDGTSPALSLSPGTFDLGTHLPSYIGGTTGSAADGPLA